MARAMVLHNPTAGDDPVTADELIAAVQTAGFEVGYRALADSDDELVCDADLVVLAGGDGTVRRYVTRIACRKVPFAILPIGTANNVARAIGRIGALERVAAGWNTGVRRPVDIGVVRAGWGSERFIESFGGGVFASMIARGAGNAPAARVGLGGNRIDRGLQMFGEAIRAERASPWRLRLDGKDLDGEYILVEAMNIGAIGPNIALAPHADPGDGRLELVTATEAEREHMLEYVAERLAGRPGRLRLPVHRGKHVRAVPPPGPLHADEHLWRIVSESEEPGWIEAEVERAAFEILVGGDGEIATEAVVGPHGA